MLYNTRQVGERLRMKHHYVSTLVRKGVLHNENPLAVEEKRSMILISEKQLREFAASKAAKYRSNGHGAEPVSKVVVSPPPMTRTSEINERLQRMEQTLDNVLAQLQQIIGLWS